MSPEQTVCFSSFRLDLPNQRLCGREDPIPLRPKTFGVLRYLVEHAGRLVTREELVKAVWPDTHGAGKDHRQVSARGTCRRNQCHSFPVSDR